MSTGYTMVLRARMPIAPNREEEEEETAPDAPNGFSNKKGRNTEVDVSPRVQRVSSCAFQMWVSTITDINFCEHVHNKYVAAQKCDIHPYDHQKPSVLFYSLHKHFFLGIYV